MSQSDIQSQIGFSLMEVIISMALIGIISAGAIPAFLFQFQTVTRNELRSGAINAAQERLDQVRVITPGDLPMSGSDAAVIIDAGHRTYSVITTYCLDPTYCEAANTRHVLVEVEYRDQEIYSVETVFTQLR